MYADGRYIEMSVYDINKLLIIYMSIYPIYPYKAGG